jgi:hypothetical protein
MRDEYICRYSQMEDDDMRAGLILKLFFTEVGES